VRVVAKALGISTEHLCRVLKQHTGHTFLHFLHGARVSAARPLLEARTPSLKEVAYLVGFNSASRFDHVFKCVCGVTPSRYRAAALRQDHPSILDKQYQ